jgi:uncharacterized protein YqjF (DUF2071 family)
MRFLTARWSNLFLATYAAPEELLRPHLPPGLEFDRRDGQCFVSLVAFDFLDTRVLGIPWPGCRNFPEMNLRMYVRHGDQRGVVFIRELVPVRLVASMARLLYNEPYLATPMQSKVTDEPDQIRVTHEIEFGSRTHKLATTGSKPSFEPKPDSVDHFFKEHEWGFGVVRGHTKRYRVNHPIWSVYPVIDWNVDIDWATLYGAKWQVMQDAKPYAITLAAGSAIEVYAGKRI